MKSTFCRTTFCQKLSWPIFQSSQAKIGACTSKLILFSNKIWNAVVDFFSKISKCLSGSGRHHPPSRPHQASAQQTVGGGEKRRAPTATSAVKLTRGEIAKLKEYFENLDQKSLATGVMVSGAVLYND
jgi:hypothetical protein